MDNFEEKIAKCINEKLNDGTVERIINEKLEKGISSAIDDLFGYGGTAKKLIVSKVEEVMIPTIEKHDFNQYLVKMDTVLTELINKTSFPENKQILENFQCIMKDDVESFAIVPISKVYEKWKEMVASDIDTDDLEVFTDDRPCYQNATVNMEIVDKEREWLGTSYNDRIVKFTCDEDESMNCEFPIHRYSDKEYWNVDMDSIPMDILSLHHMNEFEIFIQKMRRNWSKIDVDIM